MFKLFFSLILITNLLYAKSWYNNFHPSLEAGMHLATFKGNIENINSTASFENDLGYDRSFSSYFVFGLKSDYKYFPHFYVSYFNETQSKDVNTPKKIYVANAVFDTNSSLSSTIDYKVINVVLYKDLKIKGERFQFLRWNIYPGDIEFDIGMSAKIVHWKIQLTKNVNNGVYPYWIIVDETIPLPYFGFKHYFYNLRTYGSISALSLNNAKSLNYEVGIEYRLIKNLYISASYLYEGFEAVEERNAHRDTVSFKTVGNKFSFKYFF